MTTNSDPFNLIVCGIGGQGNILISRMIGRILAKRKYLISIGETFGAAQRGSSVYSSMRISRKHYYGPLIPKGRADLVVSLEPLETLRILTEFGNEQVVTVTNTHPVHPIGVLSGAMRYPDIEELVEYVRKLSQAAWVVNVTQIAVELGSAIVANIVLMGALVGTGKLPLTVQDVENEIRERLPARVLELNLTAFRKGMAAVS
jgi:indolepyruvate ferredoxin oxidoreductase beta subunit